MYRHVLQWFLLPYLDDTLEVRKKMQIMVSISILVLLSYVGIITIRLLVERPGWHIYTGDMIIITALALAMFFVRLHKPLAAGNCFFGLIASMFFQKIIAEFMGNIPHDTGILYESLSALITGLIFFTLIAINQWQILFYSFASTLFIGSLFTVVVSYHQNGHISSGDWQTLTVVTLLLTIAGLFCSIPRLQKNSYRHRRSHRRKPSSLLFIIHEH
jgi:hypothetical protein